MLITRITQPSRRPSLRKVHFDAGAPMICHVNVVARFRLRAGLSLSDQQIVDLQRAQVRQDCFDQALKYLKVRQHSRAQLRGKLVRRRYDSAMIEDVLDQLAQLGYVNDEEFARSRAEWASQRKSIGRERTRADLLKAGVEEEVVNRALDEVLEPSADLAIARELVRKQAGRLQRLSREVARRRVFGMLQRRGFEYETVKPIVDELLGEDDSGE